MNLCQSFSYCAGLTLTAAGMFACSAPPDSDPGTVATQGAPFTSGGPDLMWQDVDTGEMLAWVLDGTTVVGTQTLDIACGKANGCLPTWSPVQTLSSDILWESSGGQFDVWAFDDNGNVTGTPLPSNICNGSCPSWQAIGDVTLNSTARCGLGPCNITTGILFHDPSSGDVNVINQTTGDEVSLNKSCGPSDGCSASWQPVLVADFNGDGNSDLLWFDPSAGYISYWVLSGDPVAQQVYGVTATPTLNWTCSQQSGCSTQWRIIGAADVNHDGHVDIAWFNSTTGVVSIWYLDGHGNVLANPNLSSTCGPGCSPPWRPLGFVNFPPQLQ